MLVGHMPDMAELAGWLVSPGREVNLVFKKAAVCLVSFPGRPSAGSGELEWLLQPRLLRKLG
jgi:phosphohistidine phosphatase SixA